MSPGTWKAKFVALSEAWVFYLSAKVAEKQRGVWVMPGIPLPSDPSYSVFWVSFWAALYSGAIYSVITGVVVGIFILLVQKYVENMRDKRDMEREFAVFLQEVRALLIRRGPVTITNPETAAPKPAKEVQDYLVQRPIDVYRDVLRNKRRFFEALSLFQSVYLNFSSRAYELHNALRGSVRRQNAQRNLIEANDPSRIMYYVGRLLGFEREHILPWADLPVPEAEYEQLSQLPELSSLSVSYVEAWRNLKDATEKLQRIGQEDV